MAWGAMTTFRSRSPRRVCGLQERFAVPVPVGAVYGGTGLDLGHTFVEVETLPENDRTRRNITPAARREPSLASEHGSADSAASDEGMERTHHDSGIAAGERGRRVNRPIQDLRQTRDLLPRLLSEQIRLGIN